MTDIIRHFACQQCNEPFTGRELARFCSQKCRSKYNRDKTKRLAQAALDAGLDLEIGATP